MYWKWIERRGRKTTHVAVGFYFAALPTPFAKLPIFSRCRQITFDLRKPLNELKEEVVRSSKLGKFELSELRLFYLGRELKNGGRSLESLGVGAYDVNVIHVHPAKIASATWKAPPTMSNNNSTPTAAVAPTSTLGGLAQLMQPAGNSNGLPPLMAGFQAAAFGPSSNSFASLLRRTAEAAAATAAARDSTPAAAPAARPDNNEVIEIGDEDDDEDDDEVEVTSGPPANLLTSLRQTGTLLNQNEVVDLGGNDDDDDDVDEDESDDDECVVVGTVPPPNAKRQRYE